MQLPLSDLKGSAAAAAEVKFGAYKLAVSIIRREGVVGLYGGLGVVLTGIIPKTAIRFTSFESYKGLLADKHTGLVSGPHTFAGILYSMKIHHGSPRDSRRAADVSFAQKPD